MATYAWKKRVQTHYLNPSSGICSNMLTLAARRADANLATDVFSFLKDRGTVFEHQHYEALIEAHISAGNLSSAMGILSIMQDAGVIPVESSTRAIYAHIRWDLELVNQAFKEIRHIQSLGSPIPIAAMNVLIEAAVNQKQLDLAIDLYKAVHEVCAAGANTATFNILLRGCRECGDRKDLALGLAGEMTALRLRPDRLTYDRMLLICIRQVDDYEDGMRYYKEMRAQGLQPRDGTLLTMTSRLAVAGDKRVYELLGEMEKSKVGSWVARVKKWVDENLGNAEANVPFRELQHKE
jgi:hypothetical protein